MVEGSVGTAPTLRRLGSQPLLDGVRGMAVLGVLGIHFFHDLFPGGNVGVDCFMVLSGFLITTLLLTEWGDADRIALPHFYARRALRLLPALWIVLAADAVLRLVVVGNDLPTALSNAVLPGTYVYNWLLIRGAPVNELSIMWSLSVEEQFYLLWPLLLLAALRLGAGPRALLVVIGVLAGASLACQQWVWRVQHDFLHAYDGTDTRAYQLLAGAALAVVYVHRLVDLEAHRRAWRALGAACFAAILLAYLTADKELQLDGLSVLLVLAAGGLILACVAGPGAVVARPLGSAPLRYVGRISYGLYLWHFVLLSLIVTLHPEWSGLAVAAVGLPLTFAVCALQYRYVEAPVLRRKDRFPPARAVRA